MDRLFLIDGHALVFKMYYAFMKRPMVNSRGEDTSILYGFTKYLLELAAKEQPTHLAVAFDPPGGTFRNKMYPQYKANRPPTPELIVQALEPLTEIVKAMNVPVVMMKGFEADDVIGSIAARYSSPSLEVCMLTPDKDYGQLVGPHTFQYKPGNAGNDTVIIGVKELCDKWGISKPSQVIDMLAICGDAADNVPGVKGVGEVGASKLIAKYGSLEGIYDNLDFLAPRQKAMFLEAKPHIGLSKELVTIKTDLDLPLGVEDMRYSGYFSPRLEELFKKYEFPSLKHFLSGKIQANQDSGEPVLEVAAEKEAPGKDFDVKEIGIKEFLGRKPSKIGIVTKAYGEGVFAPARSITVSDGEYAITCEPGLVKDILEDSSVQKYGEDLKRQWNILLNEGICLAGKWKDINLMHYVIDPEQGHSLSLLAFSMLGISLEEDKEVSSGSLFEEIASSGEDSPAALREAAACVLVGEALEKNLPPFYESMEEPLAKVLGRMERNGVKVDLSQLSRFADQLRRSISSRESAIREMASEPNLNISSPKQVGDILFEKLALDPKAKKSSRGQYSTDEATLLEIASRHPIVNEILEFRAEKKLLSTYIEPFPSYVSEVDGRVHTTFNQALTATGRLSSSNPNLQNIPIRTERGKEIRKAFIPGSENGLIVSADYSQIELRIMAHLCSDEHLIKAFRDGIDVHAATASKIFNIPVEEVSREQRSQAKTANFGIMYGISSFGLAQRLQMTRIEAKSLIQGYFESFPAIKDFIEGSIEKARRDGYVQTLFGRRRYLPDINSKNPTVRAYAERNAVNAPIQGTSADIIKIAMARVQKELLAQGLESRMVLQIHDELVFDAVPSEVEQLKKLVVEAMENVIELSVPLTVECSAGKNWLEAH